MARILDGRMVRDAVTEALKARVAALSVRPKLVIFQVGANESSSAYIRQKRIFGEKLGCEVELRQSEESISGGELSARIVEANADASVHGIIVQLPLPGHIDPYGVIESIAPEKDVDGLTAANLKLLWSRRPGLVPATAKGVMTLLDHYGIEVDGRHAVVVGRSELVGKPLALALLNRNATVSICHRHTRELSAMTRTADILIFAAGAPRHFGPDFVRAGQVVIDVGTTPVGEGSDRKLVGDADFDAVKDIVDSLSPVPGGVGPMTVLSLFENLVTACEAQARA